MVRKAKPNVTTLAIGDGANDVLYLKTFNSNCFETFNFELFDRWGNRVFETDDISIGWDGARNNKPCDTDVFVYKLRAKLTDNTVINKNGNLSLIR